MARKSRTGNTSTQSVPLKKPTECFKTAIYARLSVENSGKVETKDAIGNQIAICKSYVDEHPALKLVDCYVDDGYTGVRFDRPQFSRLMDDIKAGNIQCLVVRDLSRFGRDYIETGIYLERIFPTLGLRFISIKEQYDSFACDQTNEALMIPLQNMINSLYSKDISKKVSSALRASMESGTFRKRNLPYGYRWNDDRNQIIVDEATAPIVKLIFQWKIEGVSVNTIIKRLNEMNAPNTEKRKRETGVRTGDGDTMSGWHNNTLHGMFINQCYVGDTVLGKTQSALYKGLKNTVVTDPSQWFVFPNTHEAIISREDFAKVQAIMKEASDTRARKMIESKKMREALVDLFAGKVFCADCGKIMYFRRHKLDYSKSKDQTKQNLWHAVYLCSGNYGKYHTCTPHNLQQRHLNEKVLAALQMQVKATLDDEKLLLMLKNSKGENNLRKQQQSAIARIQHALNGIQKKRIRLYEDFANGILTQEEYLFAKAHYDEEFSKRTLHLEELLHAQKKFGETFTSDNQWFRLMKSVQHAKKLSASLVEESIEKILVHQDGQIEIIMKYADVYAFTKECIANVQKEDGK